MRIRHALAATLAGALTLGLAACSSDDASSSSEGNGNPSTASFPVEVTHALGTTTIPEKPERVAAVGWGNQDVALALGIVPVGTDTQVWNWTSDAESGLYEWSTDAIKKLGGADPVLFTTSDGPDFEAISDTKPDVILAALSGLDKEQYKTLSEIAPVVAYPEIPWYTLWRQQIVVNAEALGLKPEGEALVADLEKQISDATADAEDIKGKKAAFLFMDAADLSTVSLYTSGDGRTAFLEDLGFELPDVAVEASKGGSFYLDISAENVDKLADLDVIVAYGGDELLKALQADPLWSTLPAVKNGAVVTVGQGVAFSAAVSPTALSIPWVLDDYVARLNDAAAKVK